MFVLLSGRRHINKLFIMHFSFLLNYVHGREKKQLFNEPVLNSLMTEEITQEIDRAEASVLKLYFLIIPNRHVISKPIIMIDCKLKNDDLIANSWITEFTLKVEELSKLYTYIIFLLFEFATMFN